MIKQRVDIFKDPDGAVISVRVLADPDKVMPPVRAHLEDGTEIPLVRESYVSETESPLTARQLLDAIEPSKTPGVKLKPRVVDDLQAMSLTPITDPEVVEKTKTIPVEVPNV